MRPPVSSGIALRVWALLLLFGAGLGTARGQSSDALSAGEIVSAGKVARLGTEPYFSAVPIGEEIEARMRGKSYKANCTIPFDELRYLSVLHYDLNGNIRRGDSTVRLSATTGIRWTTFPRMPTLYTMCHTLTRSATAIILPRGISSHTGQHPASISDWTISLSLESLNALFCLRGLIAA